MQTIRSLARRGTLLLLPAAALLLGCGDSAGPTLSVAGSYTLQSVNGNALPVSLQSGEQLLAGTLVLRADGTFTDNVTLVVGGEQVQEETTGTWSQSGSTVTLTPAGGGAQLTATATAGSLTFSFFGSTYLYVKD